MKVKKKKSYSDLFFLASQQSIKESREDKKEEETVQIK